MYAVHSFSMEDFKKLILMDFFLTIGKLEEILQKQNSFSTKNGFRIFEFFL